MSYILLRSGGRFYFDDPWLSVFTIPDITGALARLNRFNGQTEVAYSVAQHCINTSYLVPPARALGALWHDAAEAFTGDITTPLKMRLGPVYKELEGRIEQVVFHRLNVNPYHATIKQADLIMLATERQMLFERDDGEAWDCLRGVEALTDEDIPWNWKYFKIGRTTEEESIEFFNKRLEELLSGKA